MRCLKPLVFVFVLLALAARAQVSNFTMAQFNAYGDAVHDDGTNFNLAGTVLTAFQATNTHPIFLSCVTTNGSNWFKANNAGHFLAGLTNIVVDLNTTGIIFTSNAMNIGDSGLYSDNLHDGRILSVTNGATSVTLSNAALITLFVPGQYALVSGVDMQGFGYPPNWAVFEYVLITSTNSSGVIGITSLSTGAGLKNFYEATWPGYYFGDGFHTDNGGPASIYALRPTYNTQVQLQNGQISVGLQSYFDGLQVSWSNIDFSHGTNNSYISSQNNTWWGSSVTYGAGYSIVFDKEINTASLTNCTAQSIIIESASINNLNIVGGTYTNISGLTGNVYMSGVTASNVTIGPAEYGGRVQLYMTNCHVTNGPVIQTAVNAVNDVRSVIQTNGNQIFSSYTNGPYTWATPYSMFSCWGSGGHFSSVGHILDMWQDANSNVILQTDSSYFNGALEAFDATNCTFVNCDGNSNIIGLCNGPKSNVFGTFAQITYTTNINASSPPVFLLGELQQIIVNVQTPYTGAQGTLNLNFMNQFGFSSYYQNGVYRSAGGLRYNPVIDANQSGVRYIVADAAIGGQSGDSALATTGGYEWFGGGGGTPGSFQLYASKNISAESSVVWPSVTISWFTGLPSGYYIPTPPFAPARNF